MSRQHAFQHFDQNVFETGPYLKAFDVLKDIDSFEHGILTYLGSQLPPGRGVINSPVSPSIPEIFRATKMSVSTVRRKLQSLEKKGYLIIKSNIYTNSNGKTQQGANEYLLTSKTFDAYFATIPVVAIENDCSRLTAIQENSDLQNDDHTDDELNASSQQKAQQSANDAEMIVSHWEKCKGTSVCLYEREEFTHKFKNANKPTSHYIDKIGKIITDPSLARIAQNINSLFILREPSDKVASKDTHPDPHSIPKDDKDLLSAINSLLAAELSDSDRERLGIIRETVLRCNFDLGLKLYKRHYLQASRVRLC